MGDAATTGKNVRLALNLVANSALDRTKRVHVLGFGARAQLLGSVAAQRNVCVATHVAALHASVRNAQGLHNFTDAAHIRCRQLRRLCTRAKHRLGDDFDQRNTGTVVVNQRILGTVDATGVATDVSQLASILFHVSALDGDGEYVATGNLDVDGSFERDRLVILRGLKVLG